MKYSILTESGSFSNSNNLIQSIYESLALGIAQLFIVVSICISHSRALHIKLDPISAYGLTLEFITNTFFFFSFFFFFLFSPYLAFQFHS
jgi:hypothetical protein